MASLVNTKIDTPGVFVGEWEDVQRYVSTHLTVLNASAAQVTLQWANARRPTDKDIIKSMDICLQRTNIPLQLERDHVGRWFRLKYNTGLTTSMSVVCMHKDAPTQIRFVDDDSHAVSVTQGSLHVVLADSSGALLSSTNVSAGRLALWTSLECSLGVGSLSTVDTCYSSMKATLRSGNAGITASFGVMTVAPTDASGRVQASTVPVSDAAHGGVALYLSTEVHSTLSIGRTVPAAIDALYVHAVTETGDSFSTTKPIYIKQVGKSDIVRHFDISGGVTGVRGTLSHAKVVGPLNLYGLFCYNEGPELCWLRVYDHDPRDGVIPDVESLLLNVALIPEEPHDLRLPQGIQFNKGLCFLASADQKYESFEDPGARTVFVSGIYNAGTTLGPFLYPPYDLTVT